MRIIDWIGERASVVLAIVVCAALAWMAWPALWAPTDVTGRPIVTADQPGGNNFTPGPGTPDNFTAEERPLAGGNITLGNKAE